MDASEIVKIVRDVGFPIGITIYLLVRFDRLMQLIVQQTAKELEILYQIRDELAFRRHDRQAKEEP
jgi:hypothetical protein